MDSFAYPRRAHKRVEFAIKSCRSEFLNQALIDADRVVRVNPNQAPIVRVVVDRAQRDAIADIIETFLLNGNDMTSLNQPGLHSTDGASVSVDVENLLPKLSIAALHKSLSQDSASIRRNAIKDVL